MRRCGLDIKRYYLPPWQLRPRSCRFPKPSSLAETGLPLEELCPAFDAPKA